MKTFVYKYDNDVALENFIRKNKITNSKNVLVQIFSGILDKNFVLRIRDLIKFKLPGAAIIGATTDGEIYEDRTFEKSLVISFSIFEKTKVKTSIEYGNEGEDSFLIGKKLAFNSTSKKTRVMISFASGLNVNGEEFVNGISSVNKDVVLAGGLSGDNSEFKSTFVFNGDGITEKGAVCACLCGDDLIIHNKYNFDFVGVGKFLEVTKSDKNRVYEIDGVSTFDIYKKYLGEDVAKNLPATGIEFPFLIERDGVRVARAVTAKFDDGSLQFAGNINVGDKVQFTFGNTNMMTATAFNLGRFFENVPVESFFIYSCMARKRLMREFINVEIAPLSNITSTSGFFTYGEFFHSGDENHLLNETMTILALSESKNISKKSLIEKTISDKPSYMNTMKALSNLINVTTSELESANFELDESAKKATELQNFTSAIFDSQSNITIVSSKKEKKMIDANAAFFSFFRFKNVEEFVSKYGCICEFFVEENGFIKKYNDGIYWLDYILQNPNSSHKALLYINGKKIIFAIKAKELNISGDELYIISLVDITEIENINLLLEKKVKERTLELEGSNKKLLELDQMKNDFIGIASHELRTPMTVIKNYAAMIIDGGFGEVTKEQYSFLSKILNNTEQLINLVNDILDINKLEAGKIVLRYQKIDLFELLEGVKRDFLPLFEKKKISFLLKNENKGLCIVNTDKDRLVRVFNNLLGNSLKFTNEGGKVEILVSDDGDFVKVCVKDTGVGIPEDKIKTIFEKFSQVDSHLQRNYNGTGLGLSIVKMIVERMGGKVYVESKIGKGSNFFFTLKK